MNIWTPDQIVELVKATAWPLIVLLIGIRFKSSLFENLKGFFSKNSISKISAGSAGVSAEFVAIKQVIEAREGAGKSPMSLPDHMNAAAIKARHESNKTELSEELYKAIKTHLVALALSSEDQIDLLCEELSIMQSAIRYIDFNKVMFRSQYNLFSVMANNGGNMSESEIQRYFASARFAAGEGLSDWDWIKYLAYPSSVGLISSSGEGYSLSVLGKSYVAFMARNPQFIDELAKL